jgi:Tfp pilus assembly protein PilO
MTGRDRLVMVVVAFIAIVGLAWIMAVSPERKKAHEAAAEVATAQSKLAAAKSQLGSARAAQARSAKSYATIAGLGKAVPTEKEVPALIYELAHDSKQQSVDLTSISSGSPGSSGSSGSAATAAAGGFTQVPFTFVFSGSYFALERMVHRLSSLATRTRTGSLVVDGRLITIQSVQLAAPTTSLAGPLTATVTASVYALAPEQGGGAAGSGAGSAATPAGSGGAGTSASPTTPATIKASP